MKIIFGLLVLLIGFSACRPTRYMGGFGQLNATQVELSEANFKVLGSFTGVASERVFRISIKKKEGLIAQAKADLLAKAKAAGVDLTGSRTMINTSIDWAKSPNRVTVTMSAEIIEFIK